MKTTYRWHPGPNPLAQAHPRRVSQRDSLSSPVELVQLRRDQGAHLVRGPERACQVRDRALLVHRRAHRWPAVKLQSRLHHVLSVQAAIAQHGRLLQLSHRAHKYHGRVAQL